MTINLFILLLKIVVVHSIIGGIEVKREEAPFQANYADICGAVIIHKQWALTTAHCGLKGNFIRIGSRHRLKGPKIRIQQHIVHPKYKNRHEFDHDVQLLRLFKPLHFNELVNKLVICDGFCGDDVKVYGWGYVKERGDYNEHLQRADILLVPDEECQKVNKSWYNHTLTSSMFCAGGGYQDACQGDSGGPAVASGFLIGLSSFGYGCGRHIPGVYANVSEPGIRDWIRYTSGDK